jgi:hypothetical protein
MQRVEDEVAVAPFDLLKPRARELVVEGGRDTAVGDETLRGARRAPEQALDERARGDGRLPRTVMALARFGTESTATPPGRSTRNISASARS